MYYYLVKGYITVGEKRHHVCVEVEAESVTEAETKAQKEGIVDATSVSIQPKIKEVFRIPTDEGVAPWYICTVGQDVVIDEKKGVSKRITYQWLLQAESMDDAYARTNAQLAQGYDMALISLKKSNLYDVIE